VHLVGFIVTIYHDARPPERRTLVEFRSVFFYSREFCDSTMKQLSRYSDWLRAGWFGDRIPVGGEIFHTCPDRPCSPLSLLYNGYRVFPGGKERPGLDADPSPLLVPWSRKSRVIPLLPYRP